MKYPTATYRLQFRNGMDFDAAVAVVPYLRKLGVSHLYASPLFAATSGSTHGYDVVDHNRIDPALGGRAGFERLCDALREAGLGLILDIVPNHMAASLENPWWRSVLQWGERSPHARHFDVDWSRRLTLPVLGTPYEEALSRGELRPGLDADAGTLTLDYFDQRLPLCPASWQVALQGSDHPPAQQLAERAGQATPETAEALHRSVRALVASPSALARDLQQRSQDPALVDALHSRQPWQLIFWKDARKSLSYRRFFEITGLVGVRVEDPAVFDDVHRLTLELVRTGKVDGLRVDHVDGLADPAGYLQRLRREVGPDIGLWVEKILGEDEHLPGGWPVDGTTGYEFIDSMADLLADGPGVAALSQAYGEMTGSPSSHRLRIDARRQIVSVNFEGEVTALSGLLSRLAQPADMPAEPVRRALVELTVAMPVYRTYARGTAVSQQDTAMLRDAANDARTRILPSDGSALDFVSDVLGGSHPAAATPAGRLAQERFQQLTGPAVAKGIEDTLFYRDHRFIAFDEVGCDPERPAPSLNRFHRAMIRRGSEAPYALSATSTHDTKRGEDARARLLALSEVPETWIAQVARWRARNRHGVARLPGGPAPEPALEWLIFQALLGCWPTDGGRPDADTLSRLSGRFLAYLEKVLREAKLRTSWTAVDPDYESAVIGYAHGLLASPDTDFVMEMTTLAGRVAAAGWHNSLAQAMTKLLAPGVPDIYQGSEWADFSLVDPDNRRHVDFTALVGTLERPGPPTAAFPAAKQQLIARLLAVRNRHPALFDDGAYVPLTAHGPKRSHLAVFARHRGRDAVIAAAPVLTLDLLTGEKIPGDAWEGTGIHLPAELDGRTWRSVLGRSEFQTNKPVGAATLLADFPVGVFLST